MLLNTEFYQSGDVTVVAKELLGKVLVTTLGTITTSGVIVETEAYAGIEDEASHAAGGKVTNRNKIMYAAGGVAYVYLCYGIHYLFNVVTHAEGVPHAVLVRALEPLEGISEMMIRRNKTKQSHSLTAGPGALSAAMGIDKSMNGFQLNTPVLHIEDRGIVVPDDKILAGTRVGVAYAGEDALLPYRFSISGNPFVSRGKGL